MPIEFLSEAGIQLCFVGVHLDGGGPCYRLLLQFIDHCRTSTYGPCHLPDLRGIWATSPGLAALRALLTSIFSSSSETYIAQVRSLSYAKGRVPCSNGSQKHCQGHGLWGLPGCAFCPTGSPALCLVPLGFPGRVILSLEHHTVLQEFVTKAPRINSPGFQRCPKVVSASTRNIDPTSQH